MGKNISIKFKLLFIIVVPIIFMVAMASVQISMLNEKAVVQSQLVKLMDLSIASNNLVHELQKERGASAGYISSGGEKFSDTLTQQYQHTNAKKDILEATLKQIDTSEFGEEYNKQLQTALNDLALLNDKRKAITAQTIALSDAISYYTILNSHIMEITKKALFIAGDPDITREISAYYYFIQSKERAGIERAVGAAGFGGGWTRPLQKELENLVLVQDLYLDVFLAYATPEKKELYAQKIKDPSFAEVSRMRDIALNSALESVDSGYWFTTITSKINTLKDIEDYLSNTVRVFSEHEKEKAVLERNILAAALLFIILIVLLLAFVILKDLLANIANTQRVMEELSNNNTDVEVLGAHRKDELGAMARSIEVFKQGLIEKQALEEEALKAQARAEQEKTQMMLDLAESFDNQIGSLIDGLSAAATQMQSSASQMRHIADETSQASISVAASSEEASTNVATVASAMEEMSAASNEIASQINNANARSNDTVESATAANTTVSDLNQLVENIGEVVTSIRDIAEQTNLLALNATIEAARAGEAGKGFAVVADEVKKLASETSKKTEEIDQRISEIQGATHASVEAMQKIIGNISEIDGAITGVSAAVEEQNATTSEIVRSVANASEGVQNVSQIISEVQKGAAETGTSSGAVLDAAQEVSNLSSGLKDAVAKFLTEIRGSK